MVSISKLGVGRDHIYLILWRCKRDFSAYTPFPGDLRKDSGTWPMAWGPSSDTGKFQSSANSPLVPTVTAFRTFTGFLSPRPLEPISGAEGTVLSLSCHRSHLVLCNFSELRCLKASEKLLAREGHAQITLDWLAVTTRWRMDWNQLRQEAGRIVRRLL